MLRGEDVSGDHFENASVLFLDIVGFTTISDRIPPGHVVHLLKAIFRVCDDVCKTHGLTKIKTIGDSYLAVAGVPEQLDDHALRAARAAVDMLERLGSLELTMDPKLGDTSWTTEIGEINVRIGLHCGPLVAGIVGEERLQYDVWGDTVNVASRMESHGEPGSIHVSEAFALALDPRLRGDDEEEGRGDDMSRTAHRPPLTDNDSLTPDSLTLFKRGLTDVKGKGPMTTYWLEGA
jgi:class 3 adenylate cyclase